MKVIHVNSAIHKKYSPMIHAKRVVNLHMVVGDNESISGLSSSAVFRLASHRSIY